MKLRRTFWLMILGLATFRPAAQAQRPSLVTPVEPSHLVATDLIWPGKLKRPGDTAIHKVWLPPGFGAQVFASGFASPGGPGGLRMMAFDSNRTLYITERHGGRVCALPDMDNDGVVDSVITVRRNVGECHSIAFYKGQLYVAETDTVHRFSDEDHDGYFETEHRCISDLSTGGPFDHSTRTVVIDPVREKILVSVGTSCNACRQADPYRSAILEYNLDGTGRRGYATGLRNALGLTINPSTNQLWATNADRNKLGDDLPEEIVTSVVEGSFHGWPYAFGDREWVNFATDSEYTSMLPLTKSDTALVTSMRVAEVFLPAHSTPAGLHFYQGNQFPERYRTGYVCVMGSSESSKPHGYTIQRFFQDASQQWTTEEFFTGFLTDTNAYKFWARPIGIAEDHQGNLYFSFSGLFAVVKVSFDPTKSVNVSEAKGPAMSIQRSTNGELWLATSSFHSQPTSVLLESYSIAGQLLKRQTVRADATETGIKIRLSELPSGPQLIVLSSDRERISNVVNLPQ
jgi:glucose/arabinose dehydrogenase